MRYKKKLVEYNLIIDKRIGQGNPNRIYVLKPELSNFLKSQKATSRSRNWKPLEVTKSDPIDTYVNHPNLNNVNKADGGGAVENSREDIKRKRTENKENINDIKNKIKKSLEEKKNFNYSKSRDYELENNLLEKDTDSENKHSNNCEIYNHYKPKRYGSREKEQLAKEIVKELDDDHSLGAFRTIVDKIPEQQIRIFFSIIKDTYLTGKMRKAIYI